jgi:hypothetical protein
MNIIYPETLLRQRVERLEAAAGTAALNERARIVDWLRGMDESTATTLANWLDAGMYFKGDEV